MEPPILGDHVAAEAVDRIDYDSSGIVKWGTRDGRELPEWNPRLNLVETSTFLGPATIGLKPQRVRYRLLCALPAIRNYDRLYRFTF